MSAPLSCWVISDGRRGIENQALGLAEAVKALRAVEIKSFKIKHDFLFSALPAWMQFQLRKFPKHYVGQDHCPDIAIGCGRQAIAPLLALKRQFGTRTFTVYIQHPRLDPSYFDIVIAPEHDMLTGSNVLSIIGSPNRITAEKLIDSASLMERPIGKVAAWLIGGNSKTHKLSPSSHKRHLETLRELSMQDWHIWVTTSRRTPKDIVSDYQRLSEQTDTIHLYDGRGPNPYFAFLHHADAIFATEDSTNMLVEACSTGKPVYRLPMDGKAGKFQNLYQVLEDKCGVSFYNPNHKSRPYPALSETKRAAIFLLDNYDNRVRDLAQV